VREYHCEARAGDRPRAEQFGRASIAIVRSGVFGIRSGKRTRLLTTGFLMLGNAGQAYEASHEHGGGDRCLVFDFPGTELEEMAEALRRGAGRRPFAVNVMPPLPRADAYRRLAEERLASGAAPLGLEELGLSLAACVLREAGGGAPRSLAREDLRGRERVLAAIAEIDQHAGDELGLTGLARTAGLSPFSFLRLFKSETGVPPYRFLVQARIRRALALLRDTSRPITEIAFDTGFGDLSNFINAFRREVGCSPRQYRKSGPPRLE
jgi:AraC-like DNA-binding protein